MLSTERPCGGGAGVCRAFDGRRTIELSYYTMQTRISATELARRLSDVLSRAVYRGESFVIERNGEPVAALGPAAAPVGPTLRELIERLRALPRPDAGFADDLEAAHAMQGVLDSSKWPD